MLLFLLQVKSSTGPITAHLESAEGIVLQQPGNQTTLSTTEGGVRNMMLSVSREQVTITNKRNPVRADLYP
jgi:hypothetical protein